MRDETASARAADGTKRPTWQAKKTVPARRVL